MGLVAQSQVLKKYICKRIFSKRGRVNEVYEVGCVGFLRKDFERVNCYEVAREKTFPKSFLYIE